MERSRSLEDEFLTVPERREHAKPGRAIGEVPTSFDEAEAGVRGKLEYRALYLGFWRNGRVGQDK